MSSYYGSEVIDAMLPGKASKLQIVRNREFQTDTGGRVENTKASRENSGEGTRQNGTATSGEGTLLSVKSPCGWSRRESQIPGGCNCLLKHSTVQNRKMTYTV